MFRGMMIFLVLLLSLIHLSFSCSTVHTKVSSKNTDGDANVVVIARTMELGYRFLLPKWEIVTIPRSLPQFPKLFSQFYGVDKGKLPDHVTLFDPKTTSNPYGFIIINLPIPFNPKEELGIYNVISDGQNEHGLSVTLQLLQTARYQKVDDSSCNDKSSAKCRPKTVVSWFDVIPYLLSFYKTAEEVVDALKHDLLVVKPEGIEAGVHWAIDDATGAHFIVEYLSGELAVHKSEIRVMTNDPSFSWHVQNLNTYANVQAGVPVVPPGMQFDQPSNIFPDQFRPVVPSPWSFGSGLYGLPGDISPPSRFISLFYYRTIAQYTVDPPNLKEALALATNLLNIIGIPYGSVGNGPKSDEISKLGDPKAMFTTALNATFSDLESQQWNILKVPMKGLLYYRDYFNMAWKEIDFNKLDFSEGAAIRKTNVYQDSEPFSKPSDL